MPLITIIVPVYNTEAYLPRCLDSILGQSFTDYELLLVDDGSTDGSGAICDAYAEKDGRIRVFHKDNRGVSSARNFGLKEAKGTWVCFVDADDEMMPNGLKVMVDGISDAVGMVMAGYHEIEDGMLLTDTSLLGESSRIIEKNEALLFMYPSEDGVYMGYPIGKLFYKKMIKDYDIAFNEHITIKEDTLFVVNYLCRISKPVYFISQAVYKYMKTSSGAMGSLAVAYNPKYLTSFDAVVEMNKRIQELPCLDKKLSNVARREVANRYYMVRAYMQQHDKMDKQVAFKIKQRALKEVGLGCFVGYWYRRNKRRIKKLIAGRLINK